MGNNNNPIPGVDLDKIQPEGEFSDPVLRCDSCQALVKRKSLHKLGACPKCGNKRVRNLTVLNEKERDQLREWGFQDFANEFQETPDA